MEIRDEESRNSGIDNVKSDIFTRSIAEDQEAVALQWAKTLAYGKDNHSAISMAKLIIACVAMGNFQTRTNSDETWSAPFDQLTIADYQSHGSRIVLDYSKLDVRYKEDFLKTFNPDLPGVKARSSTHAVDRSRGNKIEQKGLIEGAWSSLPAWVIEARNYGIDIAMGGEGELNFYGNEIKRDGASGHFYFYLNRKDELLLCGLEQSAPMCHDSDQFGQYHSLMGASDLYTSAGSLYFSDPIYQAKLLCEMNILPPDKYNGMRVLVTDADWHSIQEYMQNIDKLIDQSNIRTLANLLRTKPKTCEASHSPESYLKLDFKNYIILINNMWILNNEEISYQSRSKLDDWHKDLLQVILKLKDPKITKITSESWLELNRLIDYIINEENLPNPYIDAVKRIRWLILKEIDRHEKKVVEEDNEKLLSVLYATLKSELMERLKVLNDLEQFYQNTRSIPQNSEVTKYLESLQAKIELLNNLHINSTVEDSIVYVPNIDGNLIRKLIDIRKQVDVLIENKPLLGPLSQLRELEDRLQSENDILRAENERLQVEANSAHMQHALNHSMRQREELQKSNAQLTRGLEEERAQRANAEKRVGELQNNNAQLTRGLEEERAQRANAEKRVGELQNNNAQLTRGLEEERAQRANAEKRAGELQNNNAQLTRGLEEERAQRVNAEEQARELQNTYAQLRGHLDEARAQLANAEELRRIETSRLREENQRLHQQLLIAENKLASQPAMIPVIPAQLTQETTLPERDKVTPLSRSRFGFQISNERNLKQEDSAEDKFLKARQKFATQLRTNITSLSVYYDLFLKRDLSSSMRVNAKNHRESWYNQHGLQIMKHFLDQLPGNITRSRDEVISAYINTLQFLLNQLEDESLQSFAKKAGDVYQFFVDQYIDHIKGIESSHLAQYQTSGQTHDSLQNSNNK